MGRNNKGIRKPLTEEHKRKIGLANKERYIGTKQSEETKKKRSLSLSGPKHPMYGKHQSQQWKKKMVQTRRKNNSYIAWNKTFDNYKFAEKVRQSTRKRFKRNKKCFKCKSKENLQFHHWIYKLPVQKKDFSTICRKCHDNLHNKNNKKKVL